MSSRLRWLCLLLLLTGGLLRAQSPAPVITAANVAALQTVARVDFAPAAGFSSGAFFMNAAGTHFAAQSRTALWRWHMDAAGTVTARPPVPLAGAWLVDAQYDANHGLVALLSVGPAYRVVRLAAAAVRPVLLLESDDAVPLSLWLAGDTVWLETNAGVVQYPGVLAGAAPVPQRQPYAPAQDATAVVRIGRVALPYVVTSSLRGRVTLWSLETGTALARATTGSGAAAVFGNLNQAASHLAWRDEASAALYRLDLRTGADRRVAALGGDYVQWFFLTPAADVILAVNRDFDPVVLAWSVDSGRALDLGPYRPCTRPQPDMARLSADGTTLVIGCDTGLDIWRVRPPAAG